MFVRRNYLNVNQFCRFSAYAKKVTASNFNDDVIEESWKTAKPYESIPGPSTFNLIRSYMPGGRFHSMQYSDVHRSLTKEHGPIYKLKGAFGRKDMVFVVDPKDFETVFRTEGIFPERIGLECLDYYRKHYKKDLYKTSQGLSTEQGQGWWDLRQKVNGVMMKPQVTRNYTSSIDEVTKDFVKILHNLRDSNLETPANLFLLLNFWALESIANIAINLRLGLLSDKRDKKAVELMENIKKFFQLTNELDIQPSVWKIYKTKKFNHFMQITNDIHDVIAELVDRGLENLESLKKSNNEEIRAREKSVLEKLYEIDKNVAIIMTVDALIAGVDTSSSGVFMVLYNLAKNPEKQNILREELIKILPEKDSSLTSEKMRNMPYLRACIKEALRLMPVVSANLRGAGRNIVLKGYQIPEHTPVLMHHQAAHMDDQFFPEPKLFLPERWLRSEKKQENYNPFAYLPFGFGSRNCIGRRFAELEMESLVARLVRNYHLEWHHPPPEIRSLTINMPHGDLKLRLRDYQCQ